MVYEIAGQNISHGMGEESLAASSAMIVSGLEKEIKPDRVNLMTEDPKIDMKQAEEFIQKLVNSTAIERIKKYEGNESRNKDKKEEEAAKKKKELKEKEKLIELAKDLKIDVSAWKIEKVNIDKKGNLLLIESGLTEEEKLRILLLDECKVLEIGSIFEESCFKLAIIRWRLFRVKSSLKQIGLTKGDFEKIKTSAQQIAFLKLIVMLKEFHLKRVFSTSKKEFDRYSNNITVLTRKIWKLDINLPQIGMDWIHQKLETLALESARYKLQLLKSMQTISFDKENEKAIHWLETTITHLAA